jgi:hypothetical protein
MKVYSLPKMAWITLSALGNFCPNSSLFLWAISPQNDRGKLKSKSQKVLENFQCVFG